MRRIVLKALCLKATAIFVILLSQDGFEKDCLELKFQAIIS